MNHMNMTFEEYQAQYEIPFLLERLHEGLSTLQKKDSPWSNPYRGNNSSP